MIIVTIEREGCISCGQCQASFPEFFEEDPDDWSESRGMGSIRPSDNERW